MRAHVCVVGDVCVCSRWVHVCAAELVSLPLHVCACMHVCVSRDTGWGGFGAECDCGPFHRDALGEGRGDLLRMLPKYSVTLRRRFLCWRVAFCLSDEPLHPLPAPRSLCDLDTSSRWPIQLKTEY